VAQADVGLDLDRLRAILGADVSVVADCTSPWAATTQTTLVKAAGNEYVVQRGPRRSIARRARLAAELNVRAPQLLVPQVVAAEVDGSRPFLVARRIAGTSGRELLGDDQGAARLGEAVGRLSREIAAIPTTGLRLSRTWAAADRLAAAATDWLARCSARLTQDETRCLNVFIERLPDSLDRFQPVFAHGDLAPVNVLVARGEIVALLDLERVRLAHPLFDAAWWSSIVGFHHPARWQAANGAFLRAAALRVDDRTAIALGSLGVLQLLEMASANRAAAVSDRWLDMLRWRQGQLAG
jgi:aminoglycoside phosphotransferase (APT) family kinase protein